MGSAGFDKYLWREVWCFPRLPKKMVVPLIGMIRILPVRVQILVGPVLVWNSTYLIWQ